MFFYAKENSVNVPYIFKILLYPVISVIVIVELHTCCKKLKKISCIYFLTSSSEISVIF